MKKRLLLLILACLPILAVFVLLRQPDAGLASDPSPGSSEAAPPTRAGAVALAGESAVADEEPLSVAELISRAPAAESGQEPLPSFVEWTERYLSEESPEARERLVAEGVVVAAARRQVMKQMIQDDPEAALRHAVPWSVRAELPDAVAAQLEKRVNARGDFDVFGIAPGPGKPLPERPILRFFDTEDERFEAFVYGDRLGHRTSRNISAHGIAVDGVIALHENPLRILEAGEPLDPAKELASRVCPVSGKEAPEPLTHAPLDRERGVVAADGDQHFFYGTTGHVQADDGADPDAPHPANIYRTLGEKTVLVIRVNFEWPEPDEEEEAPPPPPAPVSAEDAYLNMLEIDQHLRLASFQQFSFKAIHVNDEEYVLKEEPGFYVRDDNYQVLYDEALAAAVDDGFELEYDFVIVTFPDIGFSWGGLGSVGGKPSWVQGSKFNLGTTLHELGHNFGLWHARYWKPVGPVADHATDAAQSIEYGNAFDTMGKSQGFPNSHFSGNYKSILNWLPALYTHTIPDQQSTGTYRIHRLDGGARLREPNRYSARILNSNHARLPQVPRKDYWIDYRQLGGSERSDNGVIVQWGDGANGAGGTDKASHLLNMNPLKWPLEEVKDTPLAIGETFSDQELNLHVTPVSQGGFAPHQYVNVVVTRGLLKVAITEPASDPSIENIPGVIDVPIDEALRVSAMVQASASPADKVTFYLDGESLGAGAQVSGTDVYRLTLADTTAYSHSEPVELFATVTNEAGNTVRSAPVMIRFAPPPVHIDLAATPEAVLLGESVTVTASVIPASDEIQAIEFFANDVGIETLMEAPYTFEWTPESAGIFELEAIAYEFDGGLKFAGPVTVTVLPEGTGIDLSLSPETVTLGEPVTLTAALNQLGETVVDVRFLADGAEIGRATEEPFTVSWTPGLSRTFSVWAEATFSDEMVKHSDVKALVVEKPVSLEMEWLAVSAPASAHLHGITHLGEFSVAVGQDGAILTAEAGGEWIARASGVPYALRAVVDGNGLLMAVGEGGAILTSIDGEAWVVRQSGTSRTLMGLAYGGGRFVAVGDSGVIRTSDDGGITWQPRSSGQTNHLLAVAYGAAGFVGVGEAGTIVTSADGTSWQVQPQVTSAALRGVAFGDNGYVAVGGRWDSSIGRYQARILSSTDAVSWVARDSGLSHVLNDIHYDSGAWFAVGTGGAIVASLDGLLWVRSPTPTTSSLLGVSGVGGAFVAVGRDGTTVRSNTDDFQGWLAARFSPEQLADPSFSGADADPFGSGITNLLRYALGLADVADPRELLPRASIDSDAAEPYLTLQYRRQKEQSDLRYFVEASSDLLVWNPIEDSGGSVEVQVAGDSETVIARDGVSIGAGGEQRFLRLRVELRD